MSNLSTLTLARQHHLCLKQMRKEFKDSELKKRRAKVEKLGYK